MIERPPAIVATDDPLRPAARDRSERGTERGALWDTAMCALGLVVALPSLAYPLARDQAVFAYVAREWLRHGSVVYRDVFDHKTPGIYVVDTLATALLGDHTWTIRAVEIPTVMAIGWMAASFVQRWTRSRNEPGLRGTGVLAACILHFGFLGFWDTGQCEIWCVFFTLGALLYALPRSGHGWRSIVAGLLAGCSLLMKPTSLPLEVVVCAVVLRGASARRDRARALARFAGAALVPSLLSALYLWHRGALGDAVGILFGANAEYAAHENVGGVSDAVSHTLDAVRLYLPLSLVLGYGAVVAWLRARAGGNAANAALYRLVFALAAAGFLGVAVQLKFYLYHFELVGVAGVLAAVALGRDASAEMARRGVGAAKRGAIVAAHLVGLFALSWTAEHRWFRDARDAVLVAAGAIPRAQLAADFRVPSEHFDENDSERVAAWLRQQADPGDELCVRSFEPQIYLLTGMRCESRFFWTAWITDARRQYHRDEWLAEDRDALTRSRPRFVTVKAEANGGVDQEPFFTAMGYARRATIGEFFVLERPR
ncbi:MAG TPA: hypothetical protein VGG39_09280 [Polyangiaceae bacterium]